MSTWFDRLFRRRALALRRIGDALAAQDARLSDLADSLEGIQEAIASAHAESVMVHANIVASRQEIEAIATRLDDEILNAVARDDRVRRILFGIRAQDAVNRERLHALRQTDAYELSFIEDEPLVSILIPTYDRLTSLIDRALPSVLAQTHANIEVLVLGDGSPIELQTAIRKHPDPRVRYIHLPTRGPYPATPEARWHVKGSPGINAGLFSARGQWICFFADDDHLRHDALATVVRHAREERLEFAYGKTLLHWGDGREETIGVFPPVYGHQGLQGAIVHAGLRFVQHDFTDADFEMPNDWSFTHRLMRIGARIGFVNSVLADWFDREIAPQGP